MHYESVDLSFGLKNKIALVTGGLSGIGEAVVNAFLSKGAKVIIADINENIQQIVSKKYELNDVIGIPVNVTDKQQVCDCVEKGIAHFGRIDILVNSAGVVFLDDAENISEAYWDKTFDVNVKGSFLVAQAVGKVMIKSGGGKIINLASQAALVALDNHVAYCASKGAIVSMTKVLAYEWAEFNINVNCVSPTVILTELGKKAWSGQVGEDMKKQIPIQRFGYPDEVAAAILFLATNASNLITGENIVLDGGFTIK